MSEITRIAVLGAGVMGTGIAQRFAVAGYEVALYDVDPARAKDALGTIATGPYGLANAVERALLTDQDAATAQERVRAADSLEDACADADLVLEAVFEDLTLKLDVFRQLDAICPDRTILASNTSGFSIEALAGPTSRPDRVIGWHWAAPSQVMRLAEIIVHPGTSDETAQTIVEVARRVGGNPEVVKDDPFHWGFVANRVLMAVFTEADAVVRDGVATPRQVDQLVKDCFRWPVGPFEMRRGVRSPGDAGLEGEGEIPPTMAAHYLRRARG